MTPNKHGKAPLRPPSPLLTKSKVATRVALSSGMSNPIPYSTSIIYSSAHKDNSKGSRQDPNKPHPYLSHPICPLNTHVYVPSQIAPTTLMETPKEPNPGSDPTPH